MKLIDSLLDRITMYRLLLYFLIVLLCAALMLGALGYLPYSPIALTITTVFLFSACWAANRIFAYILRVSHNPESTLITALILALIITPTTSLQSFLFLSAAAGLAIASKYLLNIRGIHIFNPAAIAVVLTSFGAGDGASWWVGNVYLAPIVLIGGLLIARKIRRFQMVTIFALVSLIVITGLVLMSGGDAFDTLQKTLLHSSFFFLAFIMLTEPLTSPGSLSMQRWYAIIVGILFAPQLHIGSWYTTPEIALVIGNVFAYIVNPKIKLFLHLVKKIPMGQSTYDFTFRPTQPLKFAPGQYMEFTLPHDQPDSRGVRRYFTLASSPTEELLHIGVRFYENGSTFKKTMLAMDEKKAILAAQLSGDFTLPDDPQQPVILIAGGIGITPYRSMLKYLIDTNQTRPITLLYSERTEADIAYKDILVAAQQQGMNIICTLTTQTESTNLRLGKIDAELVQSNVGDIKKTLFYISGPHPMVTDIKSLLRNIGVPFENIKVDFFPGY
jgi:ferredoxin-NADP reductase/Na+-transporting NADH:ubiquinone oxidoreductase subunit NqrB